MARYKNGINGPVSGKVGTVVGASWRGIDYVRNVADTSKVKWSEAQVNQRTIFALVMNWIKPILPVINIVQVYVFYANSRGDRVSTSQYIGAVVVG